MTCDEGVRVRGVLVMDMGAPEWFKRIRVHWSAPLGPDLAPHVRG
ncbi:hypothetical protein [Streptomyces sp. CB01580]|nr:hypothetical protein [Streptomyces sp. CB01580]